MLSSRIRELRERMKLSQARLAEAMGVTQTAVYKWENGQSEPDVHKLRQLSAFFGVSMDDLCGEASAEPATTDNLTVMSRAFRQMTPEEQEKLLTIGRMMFAHAFDDAGE